MFGGHRKIVSKLEQKFARQGEYRLIAGLISLVKTTQTALSYSPIREILVPVDAVHAAVGDLAPILLMARRLAAKVTLLHCYSPPPCFEFAVGDRALADVSLHRRIVRSRLNELTAEARRVLLKCNPCFVSGSSVTQILRKSERLPADLIAVPLPLDLISWCWLPEQLLDELVRRASCPVLCVPSVKEKYPTFRPVGTERSWPGTKCLEW